MPDAEQLEALRSTWKEDADVLARWGHAEEAKILQVCRSDLAERLSRDEGLRSADLAEVWDEEAGVLEEYGHDTEAAALRTCRDRLRSLPARSAAAGGRENAAERDDPRERTKSAERDDAGERDRGDRTEQPEPRPEARRGDRGETPPPGGLEEGHFGSGGGGELEA